MTKIILEAGEEQVEKAFVDTLLRIKERSQERIRNSLVLKYSPQIGYPPLPSEYNCYYLAEVKWGRVLGIFPWKRKRILFATTRARGIKGEERYIKCYVYDKTILEIVETELRDFGQAFNVASVYIAKEFA